MDSGEEHHGGQTILVALGGNAIKQPKEEGTAEGQFDNCNKTTRKLAQVISKLRRADRIIITHGNGPQVGNLLVQQDAGRRIVPPQTMDIVGAMTQGQIGYMLQQTLQNNLKDVGIDTPVLAVVNQVLVDPNDHEFEGETASKPVGNFFTEEEAKILKREHPEYVIKKVTPKGDRCWRRTVPSPLPQRNIESGAIRKMIDSGIIVIASGGGGIPVVPDKGGHYRGVEAVVDKDLAGEKLAEAINATVFLVLTDITEVKLNYGQPNEQTIEMMSVSEARDFMKKGHFLPGSMGPKVEACVRFIDWGGRKAIITSLEDASDALEGKAGTLIYPDGSRP